MTPSKIASIKDTLRGTKRRRANLRLKVYTLKIDKSHLSKKKLCYLNLLFAEAKWLYNHMLSLGKDLWTFDTKNKQVNTLDKDKNPIVRVLTTISAQMRQSLHEQLKTNIINLSKAKKKGRKTGRLKFKSFVNSIKLKQPGITYRLTGNYLSIQGFKGEFKLSGIKQLENLVEMGEARIVRQAGDFYLKLTCYEVPEARQKTGKDVGLDFGIKTTMTTSDNEKVNIQIGETRRLKKLSCGLHKKVKGSRNRFKQKILLQKEYNAINNQKRDLKNKAVRELSVKYDMICFQDENVEGWKRGWFGRQVQRSVMGGIIAELKRSPATLMVDRWFPSTKLCEQCGRLNKIGLDERIYRCECGHIEDRDWHSAKNILRKGLDPLWCVKDLNTSVEPDSIHAEVLDLGMQSLALKQEAIAL